MSKHSAQIKKILDYDDQLKGRTQAIEVQLEQARREQRKKDAAIVRARIDTTGDCDREDRWANQLLETIAKGIESQ